LSLPGKLLNKILNLFPHVKGLKKRIQDYEKYIAFEPGHYYSPIVDPLNFADNRNKVKESSNFPEINFNEKEQLETLKSFKKYYDELPFKDFKKEGLRYYYCNDFFTYSDAISLFCMIRKCKPKKIIEIGSGYSSALVLDTNEHFFNSNIQLTFIDPNTERLKKLLKENEDAIIIEKKIQEVETEIFKTLEAGDFLLIDTSHVVKSGSDVNYIYFNVLPLLKKGVNIHIHDIFFPFEYPDKWIIKENRSWNEIYLLRAYLAYNDNFKINFLNSLMEKKNKQLIENEMPLMLKRENDNVCGGIWLETN